DAQALPERPDGRTRGDPGAVGPAGEGRWGAAHGRHVRGRQRPVLPEPGRLPVGHAAARPGAQEHRLDYFVRWRDDGTWQKLVDALRAKVRLAAGRQETPSAGAI